MACTWCVKEEVRRPAWPERMSEGKMGDEVMQVNMGVVVDLVGGRGGGLYAWPSGSWKKFRILLNNVKSWKDFE